MKSLNNKLALFIGAIVLIGTVSSGCNEKEAEIAPCSGFLWGKAIIEGREVCFEHIRIIYQNENTPDAYIQLTMFNDLRNTGESIDAFFKVPVEGITLNTAFPAYDGMYYNAEVVESGSLTYSYYNASSLDALEKYSQGTFELTTQNPNNTLAQTVITGEFIYNFRSK